MNTEKYTVRLEAGLGAQAETQLLLSLWQPGITGQQLQTLALQSGLFPNVSAYRLYNHIRECFVPRYLCDAGKPILLLKTVIDILNTRDFDQLLFIFSCLANPMLTDFISNIYWPAYMAGHDKISTEEARQFVDQAVAEGKIVGRNWSEDTRKRQGRYLCGICADFGLLESTKSSIRKILPFRISDLPAIIIIYYFHFNGLGDNSIVSHPMWKLFGMEREDVINELKHLSLRGAFIVQNAADLVSIGWQYKDIEGLANAIRS